MNADEARKLTEQHEGRKKIIEELINDTNDSIKRACEEGKRECPLYQHHYQNGIKRHIREVSEHFQEQGFELVPYRDGSGHYLRW